MIIFFCELNLIRHYLSVFLLVTICMVCIFPSFYFQLFSNCLYFRYVSYRQNVVAPPPKESDTFSFSWSIQFIINVITIMFMFKFITFFIYFLSCQLDSSFSPFFFWVIIFLLSYFSTFYYFQQLFKRAQFTHILDIQKSNCLFYDTVQILNIIYHLFF